MSQADNFGVPLGPPADPYLMAQRISESLAALLSSHSGPVRPAYGVAGTLHLLTSVSPWPLDLYDGEQWLNILTINPDTHEIVFALEQNLDIDSIDGLPEALAERVEETRKIETEGLLTGGGTLEGDLTLTVPVASQGEAEAGTDNETAMTPLRTAQAIAAQVPDADEETPGVVRMATAAEARAMAADNLTVSPLHLGAMGVPEPLRTISTASGGTKTETNLPKCRALLVVISGVSLSAGGVVNMAVSADNGATWSGNVALDNSPSASYGRGANIWIYGTGVVGDKIVTGFQGPQNGAGNVMAVNATISSVTGVINAVRFSPSNGAFDGGTIRLLGAA